MIPSGNTSNEAVVRRHFEIQADACERMGSPFTALLCRALLQVLDRTTKTGRRVLDWPGPPGDDALALRLCGALHRLILSKADTQLAAVYPPHRADQGALRTAVGKAIRDRDDVVAKALDDPPQTNEVARSAMLYPGFLMIGAQVRLPLDGHEIGSSAGLNLCFDQFGYDYGGSRVGAAGSTVQLSPLIVKRRPPLTGSVTVARRSGCDIAPIDLEEEVQRQRLRSFVWADQEERLLRLEAAIEIARAQRLAVRRMRAVDYIRLALEKRMKGTVFVLFHSIMWQYMTEDDRIAIEYMMRNAPASDVDPVAWLRMEPADTAQGHAVLTLTTYPEGRTRHLAECDFHGRWIAWNEGVEEP